jgi:hypothetical protein
MDSAATLDCSKAFAQGCVFKFSTAAVHPLRR